MSKRRHRHRCRQGAPSDLVIIRDLTDACALAMALPELGVIHEALVFVRHDGVVTSMVVDPLTHGSRVWTPPTRPAERGDEGVLNIVLVPEIRADAALEPELVAGFECLRDALASRGHPLLDLIRFDGELLQSMTIVVDPTASWPWAMPPDAA